MSDSSAGQIVGGVVGGVVGFVATGFNPVGAVQGFTVGYGIGGYVDPPDGPFISAPRLNDLSFQTSTYGAPIPTIDGSIAINGNVIYLENGKYKQVVSQEQQGGKGGGGGATVESVEYFATFAVALCEAKAGAKIGKIWLGGKLVYNVSVNSASNNQQDQSTVYQSSLNSSGWSFYDGTQTEPDDRIESVLGVGNAESYEGTAYIVIKDLSLSLYGNSLTGCPVKVELITRPEYVPELLTGSSINHSAPVDSFNPKPVTLTIDTSTVSVPHWNNSYISPSGFDIATRDFSGSTTYESTTIDFNSGDVPPYGLNDTFTRYKSTYDVIAGVNVGIYQARNGVTVFIDINREFGCKNESGQVFKLPSDNDLMGCCVTSSGVLFFITVSEIRIYTQGMVLVKSLSHNIPVLGSDLQQLLMWHDGYTLYIGEDEGPKKFYAYDDSLSGQFRTFSVSAMTNDLPFSSSFVVDNGVMLRTWSDNQKVYFDTWSVVGIGSNPAKLDQVVLGVAKRCGINSSLIDASELSTIDVDGFAVLPSDGRGALSPLQGAFLFDVIPTGYKLTARVRRTTPVVVVPYGDLGAVRSGSSPNYRLSKTREMDTQLPSRLNLSYYDRTREYDTSVQFAETPTQSENIKDIEFPIVMTSDYSAKLADILMRLSWVERDLFKFSLPQKYLNLIVSDVVKLETPDREYLIRIESIDDSESQIRSVTGRLSQPALYQSSAKGSNGVPPDETIEIKSRSFTDLLDVPMISDVNDFAGYALSMYGAGKWAGGSLFRSLDGGLTYDNIKTVLNKSAVGVAINTIPYSDGFIIDRSSRLTITPKGDGFDSITESQMMTGKNWAAYGDDGRWELIRYADATLNLDGTITLKNIIRSARGTEVQSGTHQVGDRVILLSSSSTASIPSSLDRIGMKGLFKGVTIGLSVVNSQPIEFAYNGENLKPLSPVIPKGTLTASGNWEFSCTSRTRYGSSQWITGIQPQNEQNLKYEIDITSAGQVVRTITSSSTDFTYTQAQQVQDFGVIQGSVFASIYQVSDRVGRGRPLDASFSEPISAIDISDLVAYWSCGESTGTTLGDSHTSLFDGVITSSNIWGSLPSIGSCIDSNNVDYVDLGRGVNLLGINDEVTVWAWVWMSGEQTAHIIDLGYRSSLTASSNTGMYWGIVDGKPEFRVRTQLETDQYGKSRGVWPVDINLKSECWNLVIMERTNTDAKAWVYNDNGVFSDDLSLAGTFPLSGWENRQNYIGARSNSAIDTPPSSISSDGVLISGIGVINRTTSSEDRRSLYNSGFGNSYPFNGD
tara:strand:- start:2495 stop:6364 length:3870 start_codon:yes stop_codon:yes gene_type:complete